MLKNQENNEDAPDSALEKHVKEIMDPSVPDPEPQTDEKPEIDIFAEQSAPLPGIEDVEGAADDKKPNSRATLGGEDETTEEVVDDIVNKESDALLAAEDKELTKAFSSEKPSFKQKVKDFFSRWWQNKKLRWATISLFIALVVGLLSFPASRYFIFNNLGVRASASVTVFDDSTTQPLKNVQVSIAGQSGLTDSDGKVKLEHIKLGAATLTVEKRAFAPESQQITVGWGSNPLNDVKLTPVGSQYSFSVTDFLSGKPVAKAEASSGDATALSDEKGLIKLTVDTKDQEADLTVTIKASGYRDEQVAIPLSTKSLQNVKLVVNRKQAFISKRSGNYDLYSVYVDGKNESLVLAGTGSERSDLVLVAHPTDEVVAYVSTRENKHNKDGYLLSTLLLVDLSDNSSDKVAQSERIRIIGWNGDRLIFVAVAAGASAANSKRERLVSYDYKSGQSRDLASSNYFNDVVLAKGKIYYAPSGAYQNASSSGFFSINSDGTGKQTILSTETWNLFRSSYDHITVGTTNDWYDYKIGDSKATKLSGQPASVISHVFTDSPDGKHSLWVDNRDGKGALVSHDIATGQDQVLFTKGGIKDPLRWLSGSSLIFRVNTDQETADYAMSIDAGDDGKTAPPVKIKDVTQTTGVENGYYQ